MSPFSIIPEDHAVSLCLRLLSLSIADVHRPLAHPAGLWGRAVGSGQGQVIKALDRETAGVKEMRRLNSYPRHLFS